MMDVNLVLERFMETTLNEAEKKRDAINRQTEKITNDMLRKMKAEYTDAANMAAARELSQIAAANSAQYTSRCEFLRLERSETAERLADSLFEKVKEGLAQFCKTDDYAKWLTNKLNSAYEFFNSKSVTIYLRAKDAQLMDVQSELLDDTLGGIKILSVQKKIMLDYSFGTLLEQAREQFKFMNC